MEDFSQVVVGETVVIDIRYGSRIESFALKVVSTTAKRFVAEGDIHGHAASATFRKDDGRQVASSYRRWAYRPQQSALSYTPK